MKNGKSIRLIRSWILKVNIKNLLFALSLILIINCNNNANTDKVDTTKVKEQSVSVDSDEVTVQFLKTEFDAGKEFYLLDVRTPPEYDAGHLSFTDDLIPYDSMHLYLDKIPQDKETTMYIFCRSSRRSGITTTYLRALGYKNSFNVTGGIIAWVDAGYEIFSKK